MKLAIILALACLILISCEEQSIHHKILSPFMNGPSNELFSVFHTIYKKEYDIKSDEGLMRFKIFESNLKYIQEENKKGHTYTLGLTTFADMSHAEYEEWIMSRYPTLKSDSTEKMFANRPEYVQSNLRDVKIDYTSYMPPVRDMTLGKTKKCAVEAAFAMTDLISAVYNVAYNESFVFSPQQFLDCNSWGMTCTNPPQYFQSVHYYFMTEGIALESDYPYNGNKNTCSLNKNKLFWIVGSSYANGSNYPLDLANLYNFQHYPMITSIDASSQAFQFYVSGFFRPDLSKGCRNTFPVVVAATGSENNNNWIKIKNHWGTGWGEKGYMRIYQDRSFQYQCGVGSDVFGSNINKRN